MGRNSTKGLGLCGARITRTPMKFRDFGVKSVNQKSTDPTTVVWTIPIGFLAKTYEYNLRNDIPLCSAGA